MKERKFMKKKILLLIIITIVSFIIGINIFMISNNWHFNMLENTSIKEIDGKEYIGIESYSNRLRKTITYYANYNYFAYQKTEEYIEEFYENDKNKFPEYREYHRTPQTDSVIYYYDNNGNIIETKTYDENGGIVDKK